MKKFLLVTLAAILLSLPVSSNIGEPKGFLGKAYSNTLALYGSLYGKNHFDCTAEIYEKIPTGYHLITAGHCVQDIPAAVTFSVADEINGPLTPVKLIKAREEGNMDFAEFELDTNKVYPVIPLGDESTLRVGDEVINPSFAAGLGKQISIGKISSQYLTPTRDCPESCKDQFLVQTFSAPGASGSAIISKKTHKIVGIMVAELDQENVGMVVEPISLYAKFLSMPTQAHAAQSMEDQIQMIISSSITIADDAFAHFFGQSHIFMLTVHGPNPAFTQNGYAFQVDTDGFELSDDYYYNVPVYIDKGDDGYRLTSTKDGVSVGVVCTAEPAK